ncbi:MAG TPA: trigger factor [Chloroflexi bacterium]|nr:trigger factor [Chloroflexota bacterium]
MKIEKELLEDHQIRLHVEFEVEPFEKAKHLAARKIAKKVKVPGFRPGKAPYNVIVRQVGEAAVVEEAMDGFIDEVYPQMLKEAEIRPYGPGSLEKVIGLEPPIFDFLVPLEPQVELGDYKALEIAYETPEIGEDEVDEQIEELRQQQAVTETSTEPATEGNRVFYSVSANRAEVEEGQETEIFPVRFNSLIIEAEGENQNQWPFPGFSANLKGMSIEEEKDIIYTYPEDHEDENLQSVEAIFHATVTNIQKVSLPEIDDEFAKTASDFDTLEELIADIKENLGKQKQNEYDSDYNDLVLNTLVEESTVKFPPQMLEDEKKDMLSNLEYRLSQQGINFDLYLQIRNMTKEDLEAEVAPLAEERVKRGLVLAEVAKAENLQIDPQQLAAEAGRTMEIVTRGMSPKDTKEFQKSDYLSSLVNSIMADMMTRKSMNYLRAVAKGDPLPEEETEESDTAEAQETPEAEATPEETLAPQTPEEVPTLEAEETPEEETSASVEESAEAETESE